MKSNGLDCIQREDNIDWLYIKSKSYNIYQNLILSILNVNIFSKTYFAIYWKSRIKTLILAFWFCIRIPLSECWCYLEINISVELLLIKTNKTHINRRKTYNIANEYHLLTLWVLSTKLQKKPEGWRTIWLLLNPF